MPSASRCDQPQAGHDAERRKHFRSIENGIDCLGVDGMPAESQRRDPGGPEGEPCRVVSRRRPLSEELAQERKHHQGNGNVRHNDGQVVRL